MRLPTALLTILKVYKHSSQFQGKRFEQSIAYQLNMVVKTIFMQIIFLRRETNTYSGVREAS